MVYCLRRKRRNVEAKSKDRRVNCEEVKYPFLASMHMQDASTPNPRTSQPEARSHEPKKHINTTHHTSKPKFPDKTRFRSRPATPDPSTGRMLGQQRRAAEADAQSAAGGLRLGLPFHSFCFSFVAFPECFMTQRLAFGASRALFRQLGQVGIACNGGKPGTAGNSVCPALACLLHRSPDHPGP